MHRNCFVCGPQGCSRQLGAMHCSERQRPSHYFTKYIAMRRDIQTTNAQVYKLFFSLLSTNKCWIKILMIMLSIKDGRYERAQCAPGTSPGLTSSQQQTGARRWLFGPCHVRIINVAVERMFSGNLLIYKESLVLFLLNWTSISEHKSLYLDSPLLVLCLKIWSILRRLKSNIYFSWQTIYRCSGYTICL